MTLRRPSPKRKDSEFKRLLATKKQDYVVLGPIERHLLARQEEDPHDGRDQRVIHPSELSKSTWCPRAEYLKLTGAEVKKKQSKPSLVLETIWEEGHLIERKYQHWLWDLGLLQGEFICQFCGHKFWGVSPDECAQIGCVAGRECLTYAEVPVVSEDLLIQGHADGELVGGKDGIEVKSIGLGTVRVEHPELLGTHSHELPDGSKYIDYDGLWRSIKRPLPSHFRQGQTYGLVRGWERVIFIYECKWHQQTKEFVVKVNPAMIKDRLDGIADIKYALKTGRPPACIHQQCKECSRYEDGEPDVGAPGTTPPTLGEEDSPRRKDSVRRVHAQGRPDRGGLGIERQGPGRVGEEGARPSSSPGLRRPNAAGSTHVARRRPADGTLRQADEMG